MRYPVGGNTRLAADGEVVVAVGHGARVGVAVHEYVVQVHAARRAIVLETHGVVDVVTQLRPASSPRHVVAAVDPPKHVATGCDVEAVGIVCGACAPDPRCLTINSGNARAEDVKHDHVRISAGRQKPAGCGAHGGVAVAMSGVGGGGNLG